MKDTKVVITGLGALSPIGNTYETYWNALIEGKSGANPITYFDASSMKTRFACELKDFDPLAFINRKEARRMDRFTQYAMVVADEAIQHAQLLTPDLDLNRTGVIWASGIGGLGVFHDQVRDYTERGIGNEHYRFNPFFIPKMISDIAPGHISIKYGFRGPNFAVVSACASSTNAIIDAVTYIKMGRADVIITGGSEAAVVESGVGGFSSMKALSERNDDPLTASRPFDLNRDGFVLGEGAGSLVLESEEHALKRGAKIIAEVVGCGMSADAYHLTAPHPEGLGAQLVMKDALRDAN